MRVTTLAAPAVEPVGLAEAKDYLRLGFDGEDGLIADLVAAARGRIEALAGLALIERTLRVTLGCWPNGMVERRSMRLPVRPAGALVAVRVFDAQGASEDVSDRFRIDGGRAARLIWTEGAFAWPGRRWDGVEIDYVAGFGAAADDVASGLRLAVLRLAAHAYQTRDAGSIGGKLPEDVAGLISPWRRVRL